MIVRLLKLSSGETIIAETDGTIVQSDGQDCLAIMRPLQVLIMEQGIGLRMWIPCLITEPVNLHLCNIAADAAVPEGFANEYRSKFQANNIVTPPEPKLVVPGA